MSRVRISIHVTGTASRPPARTNHFGEIPQSDHQGKLIEGRSHARPYIDKAIGDRIEAATLEMCLAGTWEKSGGRLG